MSASALPRIGIGLVGAGSFGRQLGEGVHRVEGLELVGIVDPDADAAADASRRLEAPVFASLEALLDDPSVDAVVVATPHATHHDISITALSAGRHVFVEKPLAISTDDASGIIAAAETADRVLVVGHVTRLLPLVKLALERLDRGEIGDPRGAWMVRNQPLQRRGWMARSADFGMLLHSPAVHNVDLMNLILGRPTRVSAMAAPVIQSEVDYPDVVAILVDYAAGAVGSLGATVSDPMYGPGGTSSARIVGDRGGLEFDIATGRIDLQAADGVLEQVHLEVPGWGVEDAVTEELQSFAAAIRGDAEPFVTPDEALAAVAVVDAAARSIETGRTIELDRDSQPRPR